jgi:hypothetical protein
MMGFVGLNEDAEVEVQSGTFDLPLLEEGDVPFNRAALGVLER